jgi:hypothetical protein
MKKILLSIIFICLFYPAAHASDWKNWADAAVAMSPGTIAGLENKKDKTEQDVYSLTLIYYREFNHIKLKKIFKDNEKNMSASPALRLLEGIILMQEHRHEESRNILTGVMKTHPDFYPALITLSHMSYLQKDFARAYATSKQLLAKKKELSRYHHAVSLLLAAGSKSILTRKNLVRAIPAYFEVKGYFKEAQKLMPDSFEVLYATGTYQLLTPAVAGGNLDRAIGLLEKARALAPLNTNVYVRLAQGYRARGDAAAYQKNIAQAMGLDPHDELLLDYLSGEKAFIDVP